MTNVIQFPSQEDHFLIATATDDETGDEVIVLDQVIDGKRTEVGDYSTMAEAIAAMDAIMGICRNGGDAA